jgi:hypothetical protein
MPARPTPGLVRPPARVLDPIDRVSEVLFGLIMVLTFTGSLSVATAGRDDVRAMLIGALGCNLAWGIIDAVLYLMGAWTERARELNLLSAMDDPDRPTAARLVADALPDPVATVLEPAEIEAIGDRLSRLPRPESASLDRRDWLGALGVFLLVFTSTFPVVIPFLLMDRAQPALRVSNGVALALLFITGYAYGRLIGRSPVWVGVWMIVLGVVLVGLTMALGG